MGDSGSGVPVRVTCDAMCGGLARWLRAIGCDTTYTHGIDDADLVRHAEAENRVLVSSDDRLFERRVLAQGRVRGVRLPRGLKRLEQVEFVVRTLHLQVSHPRCPRCNGELPRVTREHVADRVPARSLLYATEFFACAACGKIYWNGTHWQRIQRERERLDALMT